MYRLKIYRVCLIIALIFSILLLFFYSEWYLDTQIPDVIRVGMGEGEEHTLDLGIKEVSDWFACIHVIRSSLSLTLLPLTARI